MNEKGDLEFRKIEESPAYDQKLYDFMKARETVGSNVNLRIYTDTKGVATIGIGYAFNDKSNADIRAHFASIGITLTDADITKIDTIRANPTAYRNLNADQLVQKLGDNFSFSLAGEAKAKDLFETVRPIYEDLVKSRCDNGVGPR